VFGALVSLLNFLFVPLGREPNLKIDASMFLSRIIHLFFLSHLDLALQLLHVISPTTPTATELSVDDRECFLRAFAELPSRNSISESFFASVVRCCCSNVATFKLYSAKIQQLASQKKLVMVVDEILAASGVCKIFPTSSGPVDLLPALRSVMADFVCKGIPCVAISTRFNVLRKFDSRNVSTTKITLRRFESLSPFSALDLLKFLRVHFCIDEQHEKDVLAVVSPLAGRPRFFFDYFLQSLWSDLNKQRPTTFSQLLSLMQSSARAGFRSGIENLLGKWKLLPDETMPLPIQRSSPTPVRTLLQTLYFEGRLNDWKYSKFERDDCLTLIEHGINIFSPSSSTINLNAEPLVKAALSKAFHSNVWNFVQQHLTPSYFNSTKMLEKCVAFSFFSELGKNQTFEDWLWKATLLKIPTTSEPNLFPYVNCTFGLSADILQAKILATSGISFKIRDNEKTRAYFAQDTEEPREHQEFQLLQERTDVVVFPHDNCGPALLFYLQTASGTLYLVSLQVQ
jgi:hypothetical protein